MATTATPSASRLRALTDVTNIEKNAAPQQAKPSRTPAPKVSLGGNDSVELFFDAAETPRVTQTEVKEFACTPHAPRVSTTPILATPDERLLTNAAAEEALTAAWIAAQTAEIEALRALVRRQRHEKEALIANGAGPYATSVQRAARGRLARNRAAALWKALAVSQTRRRGAVPRRAFLELRAATIIVQNRCARGVQARTAFQTALGASITLQTAARARRAHKAFTALKAASLVAATRARGALARRQKARQVAAAAAIQRVYARHKARVGDDVRPRRPESPSTPSTRPLDPRAGRQVRQSVAARGAAALRAVSGAEPAEGHDGPAHPRLFEKRRAPGPRGDAAQRPALRFTARFR